MCVLGCRGQNHNQGLEFIDTLTAPTLQPKEASSVVSSGSFFSRRPSGIQQPRGLITPDNVNENSEEKLTIITPSSVVVMSTAMPRPQPTTTVSVASEAVATDAFLDSPAETMSQPQDVSVSHSFSVVSVKYSASSSEAAIKTKVQSESENEAANVEVVEKVQESSKDDNNLKNNLTSSVKTTSSTLKSVETSTVSPNSSEVKNVTHTITTSTSEAKSVAEAISRSEIKLSEDQDPHRAPKSIVHPRNPDNRLLLLDRSSFHLSATTTQPVIHTTTTTESQWDICKYSGISPFYATYFFKFLFIV